MLTHFHDINCTRFTQNALTQKAKATIYLPNLFNGQSMHKEVIGKRCNLKQIVSCNLNTVQYRV